MLIMIKKPFDCEDYLSEKSIPALLFREETIGIINPIY